jgi:type VI secretion system secreted protein VgrG
MAPQYTQDNHPIEITTPLGKDVLLLTGFSGREEMSRLFSYQLDLLSPKDTIAAKDLVGKKVTWTVKRSPPPHRYFNGYVSRFLTGRQVVHGLRQYQIEVVPWLWFLTRNANCRIFQNKTATEIIEQIFQDRGFSDYELKTQATYPKLEYCVQYRETDFNFVSRLMEQYGIFYFFVHENGSHTLTLADKKTAYKDCLAPDKEVEYTVGTHRPSHVNQWEHHYEFHPGKWTQTDYNFETPSTDLKTTISTVVNLPDNKKYEIYDYPAGYKTKNDVGADTRVRMEEEEVPVDVIKGGGTCPNFSPGYKFTLKKHTSPSEQGTYVITAVQQAIVDASYLTGGGPALEYGNTFTCIPDKVPFRPARITPRPRVQGPQTAVVVGPKGEEIYTDKYGRVKVQFFWDREGKKDENSSCWIRVAENWAGKNWGFVFNPRIGQEVIVDFLEGDPDRPIITGRVYNAEQMPPYDLPANQTQSVVKTRSSKNGSTDNFNELRFEDKKDSEEIYFHAEKDFNRVVENNDTLKVGSDKAKDGSQTIEIWKDRTETVKTGNETITIEKGNRTETVKEGNETITIEKGNREVTISTGNDTLTIKKGNQTVTLNMGKSTTEAKISIELKVGQSSIKVDQTGVTIQGKVIKINGQIYTEVRGKCTGIIADVELEEQGKLIMIG